MRDKTVKQALPVETASKAEAPKPSVCPCGCGLPLKADGSIEYVRDCKEVVCVCGCAARFHVSSHQARIGAGNRWYAAGHVPADLRVSVVIECKAE